MKDKKPENTGKGNEFSKVPPVCKTSLKTKAASISFCYQ